MMKQDKSNKPKSAKSEIDYLSYGALFGVVIGLAIGSIGGNVALGISLGVTFGLSLGIAWPLFSNKKK